MVFVEPAHSMANADLAYQHALDRLSAVGFDSLTERERDLATLWYVEAQVNNGGFVHYYSGSAGDLAFHAPDALARLGATEKADIVRAANSLFGPSGPSRDRKERQAVLMTLSAAAFDLLEKRYYDDPADVDALVEGLLK